MEIIDSGVVQPSFMDFTLPSDFAKEALYYVSQFGHFYCNEAYHVEREKLEQQLLIYICSGTLYIETQGQRYTACQNQVVLLDCHIPHRYYCDSACEFIWFHFTGNNSQQYSDYLFHLYGVVFAEEQISSLRRNFERILHYAQQIPSNEHRISSHIAHILGLLASPNRRESGGDELEPAIQFIRKQFSQNISLDDLAAMCMMSTSHFIRTFSKHYSRTPHEYLLAYRLRQSKHMLMTTSDSIELIAEKCGFNSASHFARAFRSSNGFSPSHFRTIPF